MDKLVDPLRERKMCIIITRENNKYVLIRKGRCVGIGIYEKSTKIKAFKRKKSAIKWAKKNDINIENLDMVY